MPKVTQAEGEGYLKEKNIQAMKTLFNIAHCMVTIIYVRSHPVVG